jgi:hypothetical protein
MENNILINFKSQELDDIDMSRCELIERNSRWMHSNIEEVNRIFKEACSTNSISTKELEKAKIWINSMCNDVWFIKQIMDLIE